jgi:ribosomal protein L28
LKVAQKEGPKIASLLLIDAVVVIAAVASFRIAQRTWKGNVRWEDVTVDVSGRSNESRIRVAAACLAVAGILAVIAEAIGKSTAGRIVLVFSTLAGVAFLVFVGFTVSIYQRNQPKKLIPPSLRNR